MIGVGLGVNRIAKTGELSIPADASRIAWYDPSDATTITDTGGLVDQLSDKVGTNHLVQTLTARPTTGTRTQNGLNLLDCDAADYLEFATFPVPASGDIAVFIVAIVDVVDATSDSLFSFDATSDFQFEANSSSQFDGEVSTTLIGSNVALTGGPFAGPSLYNVNMDFTSGFYNAFVDGTQRAVDTAYTSKLDASQSFKVFANRGGNNYPDGAFGEIIITENCTDAKRLEYEAYLTAKWGL